MNVKSGKPLFICFEGIAGGSKTTQAVLLKQKLEKENWGKVVITKAYESREKEAADFLINSLKIEPNSLSMMFLFQALHSKQYEETKKALETGRIVIADRWRDSFWTYHLNFGPLSKEPVGVLKILDRLAFYGLEPDLTFLLDVPVKIAIERILSKDQENILYPRIGAYEFFSTLRKQYLHIAKSKGWQVINANRAAKEIHEDIWKTLSSILKRN